MVWISFAIKTLDLLLKLIIIQDFELKSDKYKNLSKSLEEFAFYYVINA